MVATKTNNIVRIPQIDLIRIAGSFLVILIHASALRYYDTSSKLAIVLFIVLKVLGTIGASLFVVSSGYLLLNPNSKRISALEFYKARFYSLVVPTFIWVIIYVFYTQKPLFATLFGMLKIWDITVEPYFHFYFIKIFFVLYLFTPLLKWLLNKHKVVVDILLFILLGISFFNITRDNLLIFVFSFFVYYIIGYKVVVNKKVQDIKGSYLFFVFVLMVLACIPFALHEYYTQGVRPGDIMVTLSYFNPFIVLAAVCVFLLFLKTKPIHETALITKLGHLSMHVYFMHAILLNLFVFIPQPFVRATIIFTFSYMLLFVFFEIKDRIFIKKAV